MRVNVMAEEKEAEIVSQHTSNTIYIENFEFTEKRVFNVFKRILDIICSSIGIILLSPVFLIISIAIMVIDFGNPFYVQQRIGKNKKSIGIIKFRSMKKNADNLEEMLTPEQIFKYKKEFKLDDDPRLLGYKGTGKRCFGLALRTISLDELPQLFNIFIGNLSIVGPRPILKEELTLNYSQNQQDILTSVKPGLTGYWQAYARNNVGYDNFQRQHMELTYCKKRSLIFDLKIIFKTAETVMKKDGAK